MPRPGAAGVEAVHTAYAVFALRGQAVVAVVAVVTAIANSNINDRAQRQGQRCCCTPGHADTVAQQASRGSRVHLHEAAEGHVNTGRDSKRVATMQS